jgi:hypothetical protein
MIQRDTDRYNWQMQSFLTKLCFCGTGNFISTFIKDHDRILSQTRSDEVTIVSQKFVILFSHLLQGLGRYYSFTYIFIWPAYKQPRFYSLRKEYKVKSTQFLNISICIFHRSQVTLSLLCSNIFHSYMLSNTLNHSHCHKVREAVSFGYGKPSSHRPTE